MGNRRHFRSRKNETRILIGLGFVIAAILLGLFFWKSLESQPYRPSVEDEQIISINSRVASEPSCPTEDRPSVWPVVVGPDIKSRFRNRLQDSSTTARTAGIVQIDREIMELAIQVALARGKIANGKTHEIRLEADRHLFKPYTRTFLLMYRGLHFDLSEEPTLVTQGPTAGRLVGVSKATALDTVRFLIFEDRVCRQDSSFGISIPSFPANESMVVFGHSSNIFRIITSSYSKFVPTPSAQDQPGQAVQKVERELAESAALDDFAHDVVGLAQSF